MDKIQELHYNEIKSLTGIIKTDGLTSKHAAITEDMMGRFAEWVSSEGWWFYTSSGMWNNSTQIVTTPELIKLFKEQL